MDLVRKMRWLLIVIGYTNKIGGYDNPMSVVLREGCHFLGF